MQSVSSATESESVLDLLDGDECSWCATGTLACEAFKGDDAVVCDNCGTPAARVW